MGFSDTERRNYNSKWLQAGIQDGVPSKQWYESLRSRYVTLKSNQVYTQFDLISPHTASTKTEASGNVTLFLSGVVENLSENADAIRLTPSVASNAYQYEAYRAYNDFASEKLTDWIAPTQVSKADGQPSQGYSIRLYDGDPNAGGVEIGTSEGLTGTGNDATVGWIWDYEAGMLFLSEDFKDTITDPYVIGFRYTGETLLNELENPFSPTSYFADSDTVAWWKMDETVDNTYLYDWSDNNYDLLNIGGFQEKHPCSVFGYGSRPYGDRAVRSLSASLDLQITGSLTVEGFLRLEHENFIGVDTCVNVGHDVYEDQLGYIVYFESGSINFKICTDNGNYECSSSVSSSWTYEFRCTYDTDSDEIAIWQRKLLQCNIYEYPDHVSDSVEFEDFTKVASIPASGSIQYDTDQYDYVSLASSWNTSTSAWDYYLLSVMYDQWAISKTVRTTDHIFDENVVPEKDGAVNLGSRMKRFDSVHALRFFGEFEFGSIKDYQIDWGSGANQVNAADVPLDTGGDYGGTASDVQDALEELWDRNPQRTCFVSPSYTDDTSARLFSTIQAAIDYAVTQSPTTTNRWMVIVEAGNYDEQVSLAPFVYVEGRHFEVCRIWNTNTPVLYNDTEDTTLVNFTIETLASNKLAEVTSAAPMVGYFRIRECKFVGTGGTEYFHVQVNSHIEFIDCILDNYASNDILVIDQDTDTIVKFYRCIIEGNIRQNGGSLFLLDSTEANFGTKYLANNADLYCYDSTLSSIGTSSDTIVSSTNGRLYFFNCTLSSDGLVAAANYRAMSIQGTAPSACIFAGCRFTYYVAPPNYLLHSNVDFVFRGVSNGWMRGMNEYCRNFCSYTKEVSTDCNTEYNYISDAINAAESGDVILVHSGIYPEQIVPRQGILVKGVSKSTVTIQQSSDVISQVAGSVSATFENLTIQVTTPGNRLFDLKTRIVFENCNLNGGYISFISPITNSTLVVNNCSFNLEDENVIEITNTSTTYNVAINISNTSINGHIYMNVARGNLTLTDCTSNWHKTHYIANTNATSNKHVTITNLTTGSEDGDIITIEGSGAGRPGDVTISNCKLQGTDFGDVLLLKVDPTGTVVIQNNIFTQTNSSYLDINVTTGVTFGCDVFSSNAMLQGIGGAGSFQHGDPIKLVGGSVDFYKTIQNAIDACSAGETVGISAGSYSEQISITNKTITLQGIGGTATLNSLSNNTVIDLNKTNSSNMVLYLKNIDINGSWANPTIDMDNTNATRYLRVLAYDGTLYTAGNAGAISLDGAGACSFFTKNCLLIGEGEDFIHIESGAHTNSYVYMVQAAHDGARYRLSQGRVAFENSFSINEIVVEAGNTNTHTWNWTVSNFVGPITIATTTPGFNVNACSFSRTGENITLTAANDNLDLKNCSFLGGGSSYNISSTSAVDAVVSECSMDAGMEGTIQTTNPIKEVGPGVNSYRDIADAVAAISANNQKIVLNQDQTITSVLTPPSYSVMIDGNHQFNIARAAGSPIMTLGNNDDVKFVNIDLVGSLDVNGTSAILELADHTYLNGMIDVISGDSNTTIKLDQCNVQADSTDQYCIRIRDVDPTIVAKRSYLKGDSGDPAIYFDVANNKFKTAFSAIMHGSLAANSPIAKGGAVGAINVASHHNIYNAAWAAGFTNIITGPNDSFDPDGDF